jgi:hypothetical protein
MLTYPKLKSKVTGNMPRENGENLEQKDFFKPLPPFAWIW